MTKTVKTISRSKFSIGKFPRCTPPPEGQESLAPSMETLGFSCRPLNSSAHALPLLAGLLLTAQADDRQRETAVKRWLEQRRSDRNPADPGWPRSCSLPGRVHPHTSEQILPWCGWRARPPHPSRGGASSRTSTWSARCGPHATPPQHDWFRVHDSASRQNFHMEPTVRTKQTTCGIQTGQTAPAQVAFAMALHDRLGADSTAAVLQVRAFRSTLLYLLL